MNGRLIIISSPSGGGKGTLIRELFRRMPDLGYSVSWTTRPPRQDEQNGREYHFVDRSTFEAEIGKDGFLEYAEVHGNMYGTSRREIDAITSTGRDAILEIDVQGAETVLSRTPDALSIFILPPSFEVLRSRLTARATEGSRDLQVRLRNSLNEVRQYKRFGYVIVNDELEAATGRLLAIITAERQKPDRQTEAIRGILDSFERASIEISGDQ